MRILIIDQCSGSKDFPEESPVFSAEDIDDASRESLLERDRVARQKARDLYDGRQQRYIDEAVDALREAGHEVDRYFISAGFGLVSESTELPPYEVTFNGMSNAEIRDRAAELGISEDVQGLVSTESQYDVAFFALGSNYYLGLDMEAVLDDLTAETFAVVFNQESLAGDYENAISISARTEEAKDNGSIVVALKGTYLKNFADHVTAGAAVETLADVEAYCTTEYTTQTGFDRYE
jgi:hypothetical protein